MYKYLPCWIKVMRIGLRWLPCDIMALYLLIILDSCIEPMKTSPSDKILFIPESFKRKRMYSMRSYGQFAYDDARQNTKIIKNLERSLEKDNMNQVQSVAEPVFVIPGFQQQKIQNKLWRYFLGRIELVKNKVERQQVNVCQKQLFAMKKQIQKRKELFTKKINHLQKQIKDRYKEIHSLFEEIKSQKSLHVVQFNTNRKKNKKSVGNLLNDNNEKIIGLKESIENIRNEINQYENQLQHNRKEYQHIATQWLSFLKNLLKEGYYLKNGIISIFNEIILVDYQIIADDLPYFMDEVSKKCLLQQFTIQQNKFSNRSGLVKRKTISNYVSDSKKGIQQLMQKNNLANIYHGTKDMMTNWIKKQGWKQEIVLPKIQSRAQSSLNDWRQNQRKRIVHAYQDKETFNKVRNILFGPKVQSNY